ncbi:GNAT family N-acetyltransferase [Chryseomicrobium sp. FSL W7-1435]|uniref:GNAT family N-acetyltransferase n=1 Tax=Chryseomicrobium sp. FSL W7-1435 TaxID=2921704 RepID=UPI00315A34C5
MPVTIRKCTIEDIETIQQIGRQTYFETFVAHNTEENMNDYLQKAFADSKLREELENPDSEFYVAEQDGKVAAYLKINQLDAQSEPMDSDYLEIERIYVLIEFQKLGLGKLLYDRALERAMSLRKSKIWLGVWENNHNALTFYSKIGFERIGQHSFFMGDDEQIDYILVKSVKEEVF